MHQEEGVEKEEGRIHIARRKNVDDSR